LVGTAWTDQGPDGVRSVEPRAPEAVEDAVRWGLRPPSPGAVKIGMVAGPDQAAAILRGLEGFSGPVVVDPVLSASRGGALWDGPPAALQWLLRRAALATPNAPEAAVLAGHPVRTVAEAAQAAAELHRAGTAAVLVKGGHLGDPDNEGTSGTVTDVLVTADGERRYERPRLPGASPRGTGCTLASAIAVGLARGRDLVAAIDEATTWLAARRRSAFDADGERRLP